MRLKLILAGLLLSFAIPAMGQVLPQATANSSPFYVGGGYSRYNPDWGSGRTLDGLNIYGGFLLNSRHLTGLGVEAEWHSLFFAPSTNANGFVKSETTMGGGLIYKFIRYNKVHPYAKYLLEYGKNQYASNAYVYDTVSVMGGGVEVKVRDHVWIRGDFSQQNWPNLLGIKPQKNSNPEGVTIGVTYDFKKYVVH